MRPTGGGFRYWAQQGGHPSTPWNYEIHTGGRGSVHTDAAGLDRHRPFGDFALHEFREIFRRGAIVGDEFEPGAFELLPHAWRFHRLDRRMVELLNDGVRRSLRQEKRVPGIGVDVKTLLEGWERSGAPASAVWP